MALSESRFAITGPGSLICGTSESNPFRLSNDFPSQFESPSKASNFHNHIALVVLWTDVSTTKAVFSSVWINAGSDGWVPLSNVFSHNEVADVPVISKAKITGSSLFFSINDNTNSAEPSKSKSASNG